MDRNKDTLYARWLSGDLTMEEQQQLEGSTELEDLETIIGTTDQLTLPKYDAEAAYRQFKKKKPSKKTTIRSINFREIMAIAAGVAILVFVTYFWNTGAIEATAPLAKTNTHALPDQSIVVVNDGSSIKYIKGTWETERNIELIGEAFFNVKKGSSFQVNTANGLIKVLGTKFNIRAWGDKLYVECYEGSVKVSHQQQVTTLVKDQAVNVVQGQMEEKQTINHQQPLWSTGSSRFYKENINQVLAELERQYAVIVNAPTMNRSFNGSFQHDNLEAALKAICKPMQLQYEIDGTGRIVTIGE